MRVHNKKQSNELIKSLNLNRNRVYFLNDDMSLIHIAQIIGSHNGPWAIRNVKPGGKFLYYIPRNQMIETLSTFESLNDLYIHASLKDYDDNNMVVQGDIIVNEDFTVLATLNTMPGMPLRISTSDPYIFKTYSWDMLYDKDPSIPDIKLVINYIMEHELFGMYIEFTVFDVPVGVNSERIIIWELRNY